MKFLLFALAPLIAARGQQPGIISIDVQQWRTEPVRHLYVHGVLNQDTAFHVFLPERSQWKGRLIQWLQGGLGGSENEGVRMGHHAWALARGAAYVESSQGHTGLRIDQPGVTPREIAYEASYAVVQYAKSRCVELYGSEPAYTYVFGGSGGGIRTSGLLERFPKVYDGGVPVVGIGDAEFVTYLYSRLENFRPLIQEQVAAIAEQTRVPGEGDPFAALATEEQKAALKELLRAGYPRNSLWLLQPLLPGITMLDLLKYKIAPEYFRDFPAQGETVTGVVKAVHAAQSALTTDLAFADGALYGYTLTFNGGALNGGWRRVLMNQGSRLVIGRSGPGIEGVQAGDRFTLDNRDLLAWRAYHRYVADDTDEPTMRPLIKDGRPQHALWPSEWRQHLREPDRKLGDLRNKMIAVFGSDDPLMWPTVAFRYHRLVKKALGARAADHFRLHWLEHGVHGAIQPQWAHRHVPNRAAVYKAMQDVMAWVEEGRLPAPGTNYSVDEWNQLVLPRSASERRGYQPVVSLRQTADGVVVAAEDPDGELARIDVDFEGDGKFDQSRTVRGRRVEVAFHHAYETPGPWFPSARVQDADGIENVAWIRLVGQKKPLAAAGGSARLREYQASRQ